MKSQHAYRIILMLLAIGFGHAWANQKVYVHDGGMLLSLENPIALQHEADASSLYLKRDVQACDKRLFNPAYLEGRYNRVAHYLYEKNLRDFFRDKPTFYLAS